MPRSSKSYRVTQVVGDKYGGEWPIERFRAHDIGYVVADKTASDYYAELLPALNSGRVELLDQARLISQLTQLENRAASGGRDKIGHPPGGHDDVINAAAIALVSALTVPAYVPVEAHAVDFFALANPYADHFRGSGW